MDSASEFINTLPNDSVGVVNMWLQRVLGEEINLHSYYGEVLDKKLSFSLYPALIQKARKFN